METKLKPLRKVGRASLLDILEHEVDEPVLSFAAALKMLSHKHGARVFMRRVNFKRFGQSRLPLKCC